MLPRRAAARRLTRSEPPGPCARRPGGPAAPTRPPSPRHWTRISDCALPSAGRVREGQRRPGGQAMGQAAGGGEAWADHCGAKQGHPATRLWQGAGFQLGWVWMSWWSGRHGALRHNFSLGKFRHYHDFLIMSRAHNMMMMRIFMELTLTRSIENWLAGAGRDPFSIDRCRILRAIRA